MGAPSVKEILSSLPVLHRATTEVFKFWTWSLKFQVDDKLCSEPPSKLEILKEIMLSLNPFSLSADIWEGSGCRLAYCRHCSQNYLPDLTIEMWPSLWRLATMTTLNDPARFFQAPAGFTLDPRRNLIWLCGNGLTKLSNTVITTVVDHPDEL